METVNNRIRSNTRHLKLLAKQYPTIQSVCTEITNLRAILNLPKGTEHFISDLHGEYEIFTHILNNCSGVVREKVNDAFAHTLEEQERAELCTLIYYPEQKLEQMKRSIADLDTWYRKTLLQLISVCKITASKYTRSKIRKAMSPDFAYIIDELLHANYEERNQSMYYGKILESILALCNADAFIIALASLIKRLAVDCLHVVGDIFDRGSRPDLIMDMLIGHHNVDIQWGNHDILWMAAAAGNDACISTVISGSAAYGNLNVLEDGYGINLRPLALFAEGTYRVSERFLPNLIDARRFTPSDIELMARINKASTILRFKLEGHLIESHPEFKMEDRMLLHRINWQNGTLQLGDEEVPLADTDFPTVDPEHPYRLTPEEESVVAQLRRSFLHSERLGRHMDFLYSNGSMYLCRNQNLLYHGCIPMEEDGSFTELTIDGKKFSGKSLLDLADSYARTAYYGSGESKKKATDFLWYLWCGKYSPLFGRDRMAIFERRFIADHVYSTEEMNPYYFHMMKKENCERLLKEFGLHSNISHIINGHVPVRTKKGESPLRGGGKMIIIDGGFCRAYHHKTGIAGYTLIYNSYGLRLSAHMPFESVQKAVDENLDIYSTTQVFESMRQRMLVMDTDDGQELSEQIYDLSLLLEAYREGALP